MAEGGRDQSYHGRGGEGGGSVEAHSPTYREYTHSRTYHQYGRTTVHADIVKSLHANLRKEVQSGVWRSLSPMLTVCSDLQSNLVMYVLIGRDPDGVWCELLQNTATLQDYSKAMHSLATQDWKETDHGCSRISWCVEVCENYFGEGKAIHKHLLKDLRRKEHGMPTLVPQALLPDTEKMVSDTVVDMASGCWPLLDVGSCFNPFSSFKCFEVTAIDIAPAHEVCNSHCKDAS